MTVSDWIQTVTSIVAVIIATGSLWWSIKIQHDANQPYIVAILEPVQIHGYNFVYLIIKNYGKTGAMIRNPQSSEPLVAKQSTAWKNNPFEALSGNLLAPGQSIKAGLTISADDAVQMKMDVSDFDYSFEWTPVDSVKWRTSTFHLDLSSALDAHVLYAAPTQSSKRVELEINKLTRTLSEAARESTINHL